MTATRPAPREITGRWVRLAPLARDDFPALFEAIGHPAVFAGGYGGGPAGYTDNLDDFVAFAERYYNLTANNVYGVWLVGGPHDGVLIGTSTLGDFEEASERPTAVATSPFPAVATGRAWLGPSRRRPQAAAVSTASTICSQWAQVSAQSSQGCALA